MMKRRPLVLLAGMPRAGTAWAFHMLNAVWQAAGGQDALEIRQRYHLERWLSPGNAVFEPVLPAIAALMWPWLRGESFVVKTHGGLSGYPHRPLSTAIFRAQVRSGLMRVINLYRDPRDALLSAFEYGQKHAASGRRGALFFARQVPSIREGIPWMTRHVRFSAEWLQQPGVLSIRYEDLKNDFDHQVARMLRFLHVDLPPEKLNEVLTGFRPNQPGRSMHFNKGQSNRFRQAMTPEEIALCNQAFGPYLPILGYEE